MAVKPPVATHPCTSIIAGFLLVLLSWPLAAALDAYRLGNFVEQLLHPEKGAALLRLLFMGMQLVYILYVAGNAARCRRQGVQLEQALAGAELEKARSQEILEAVADAISIQGLDMKILYQNQAHKEMMGAHLGEYCYRAYQQKDAVCPDCHLAQSFLDGRPHKRETSADTRLGVRYTEILCTPLRDATGQIVAGIEAVRDHTDRKRADLEIQRMNGELELRALELAEANRELESFNYSLSHDLRSYITRISAAQQMLTFGGEAEDASNGYLVQTIEDSCQGMENLIEAMLTLSQFSRQEMLWEDVPLSELVQEVWLQLQQQGLDRQVQFSVLPGMTVKGDRQLLRVALENLLGNAWKYTRAVQAPRIEFGVTEHQEKSCYFIRDNGAGFDMAEREKLFLPFQRLKNAQGFPGNGVGLATVQRTIRRHGGEVWGEGEPGKGAVFYFTLSTSH